MESDAKRVGITFSAFDLLHAGHIKMLEEGQRKGEVKPELDARLAAFSMDNIFLSLQFAYACDYYRIRFQMYNHPMIDRETYDEQVISEAFQFLSGALLVPKD